MNGQTNSSNSNAYSSRISAPKALGWLTLGMIAALPLLGFWKYSSHGAAGVSATIIAFGICLASASVALVVTHRSIPGSNSGAALLASMLIRTGIPLAAGMLLAQGSGWLASAGILGVVMAYYLISLILETAISVLLIKHNSLGGPGTTAKGVG